MKKLTFWHKIFSIIRDTNLPGSRKLTRKLAPFLAGAPPRKVIAETIYGFKMELYPATDTGLDWYLYYFGTYEKGTLHILRSLLKPGDTFLDVGANIGLMSLVASTCIGATGKVFSFEPHPDIFPLIQRNIEINHISNITLIYKAAGERPGLVNISTNNDANRGMASLSSSDSENYSEKPVELITLDSMKDMFPACDVIKIDVEGFELHVLKGARQLISHYKPALVIEFGKLINKFGYTEQQLLDFIKNLDYKVYLIDKGKDRIGRLKQVFKTSEIPNDENIFCLQTTHQQSLENAGIIK